MKCCITILKIHRTEGGITLNQIIDIDIRHKLGTFSKNFFLQILQNYHVVRHIQIIAKNLMKGKHILIHVQNVNIQLQFMNIL